MLIILSFLFACQEKPEPLRCEFNGASYEVGETFDAGDGCNSCSCEELDGETSVPCTEMDCSEPMGCVDMSISDCEAAESCSVIHASSVALNEGEECFAWANSVDSVGCMDADLGCGQAFTYAASPEDPSGCFGFTNTCIPQGWGDCSQGTYPECD